MSKNKKEAEIWAKKVLEKQTFNLEDIDIVFSDFITYGDCGYAVNKKGEMKVLSREELFKIRSER